MGNFDDQEKRLPQGVIIEDKRHLRDGEDADAPEESGPATPPASAVEQPETPAATASVLPPAAASAAETASADHADHIVLPAEGSGAGGHDAPVVEGDGADTVPTEEELAAMQQAEYAYLMQVFQAGLPAYLRSQLGILLNFALINLGRAPHPVTGLIATDLEQGKLAIDTFEFIMLRVQAALDPRERAEMAQLLSDLKYTFMQTIGGAVQAGTGEAEG